MGDFPRTLGLQNQKQAQALIKALSKSGIHTRWQVIAKKTPLEINNVLNSFAYSVAGQCYNEQQISQYVRLVSSMGFEKTKLAAETPIGSVYCMPIDAVAYRHRNPKATEHLTVFASEGIQTDGTFLVCTITHTPLKGKSYIRIGHFDYAGVNSLSYIPCDKEYQYSVSINELYDRTHRLGRYRDLPQKEVAIRNIPYRTDRLNKVLVALNESGNLRVPVCVMDSGTNYGIKREVLESKLLPNTLTEQGMLGLRYDYTSVQKRTQAREFLEALYRKTGTPGSFAETYKEYADLPLSYARYKMGLDVTPESFTQSIEDLCIYLKVNTNSQTRLYDYLSQTKVPPANLLPLVESAGSSISLAFDFSKLQIQHGGSMPDLRNPSEREKLRYLLESCPKGIDSALYLKQFAGRDVLTDYEHIKPITDPKLLELYGQFPMQEMSQIPMQNVNDFLTYLKENDLSAQDVGQITSQMIKNLSTPGTICKERGIAEYLKLNTVTDTKSLEHIDEIAYHTGKTIENGLDCIMHKGDTLSSLMPPLNPVNVIGNFIDL